MAKSGELTNKSLAKRIDKFIGSRILVIGDIIVDEFVWGKVERVSPEAPVPIVNIERESLMLGGAGNVVHNIISLGGNATVCGVIGSDSIGWRLREMLINASSPTDYIIIDEERPTTVKTRVVAHSQQVVRVDREDIKPINSEHTKKILEALTDQLPILHAVIIADYGKGVITQELMDGIRSIIPNDLILAVDPKIQNIELYKGSTLITPNSYEAKLMSGTDTINEAGRFLLDRLDCEIVLITRGEEGMSLFLRDQVIEIPTAAKKVFDVSGAGDTVISTFTLSLVAGLEPKQAAILANAAAGLVVAEVGTAAITASKLKEFVVG
jgi:rfaE bifunctional protein kinase chain/domain